MFDTPPLLFQRERELAFDHWPMVSW